jgi:hypothetical protein
VSQAYRVPQRQTSRILPQIFDLENATSLGGLNHLARFVKGLGLDRRLADRFRWAKASWAHWRLDRVLRVMLDASFAGIERLYHFEDLETEPLLCAQHGVDRLPDLKTLYRDLRRFEDPELLDSLQGVLREITIDALADQNRIVLEFDSTVETLYGCQEGAERGPNPKKPGRVSYHPLLVRDRISDLIVHHVLRPGSAGTATEVNRFVHQSLDIVKSDGRTREILARMDSGFETDQVLRTLERRDVGYVLKMKATPDLAFYVTTFDPRAWRWVEFEGEGEIQQASFYWQRPTAWKEPRRVVVLRKRDTNQLQGQLFDSMEWSYSFYVTNLDWAPEEIARFYDKRADVERAICEAKNDLSIGHVPTSSFGANAADLALKILARNLMVLYRDRGLRLSVRYRIMTLRRRFLYVAGRIVRTGGRLILRLSNRTPLQDVLRSQPQPT